MAAMFIFMVLSFEKWRIQLPNPNLLLIDSCPSFNFTFFHHLPANPGQTMRCWRLLRSSPLGTSVPAWLQPTILVAAFNPLRFFWWKHGQHACPWVTFFLMETWSTCMSLEPSDLDALCGLHQCWFLCWKSQGATAANGPDNNRKTITAPGLPMHNP